MPRTLFSRSKNPSQRRLPPLQNKCQFYFAVPTIDECPRYIAMDEQTNNVNSNYFASGSPNSKENSASLASESLGEPRGITPLITR